MFFEPSRVFIYPPRDLSRASRVIPRPPHIELGLGNISREFVDGWIEVGTVVELFGWVITISLFIFIHLFFSTFFDCLSCFYLVKNCVE